MKRSVLLLAATLALPACAVADETIDSRIGKLTFESGYPSRESGDFEKVK